MTNPTKRREKTANNMPITTATIRRKLTSPVKQQMGFCVIYPWMT